MFFKKKLGPRGQERGDAAPAALRHRALGQRALEQPCERAEVDARVAAAKGGAQPLLAARLVRARVVGRQDLREPRDQRVDALAQRPRALFLQRSPHMLDEAPGQLCVTVHELAVDRERYRPVPDLLIKRSNFTLAAQGLSAGLLILALERFVDQAGETVNFF